MGHPYALALPPRHTPSEPLVGADKHTHLRAQGETVLQVELCRGVGGRGSIQGPSLRGSHKLCRAHLPRFRQEQGGRGHQAASILPGWEAGRPGAGSAFAIVLLSLLMTRRMVSTYVVNTYFCQSQC